MPLGGLGDIGRNMAVLEYDGQLLLSTAGCCSRRTSIPGST